MSGISKFDFIDRVFSEFESYQTKSIYEIISREELDPFLRGKSFQTEPSFLYREFGCRGLDYLMIMDRLTSIRMESNLDSRVRLMDQTSRFPLIANAISSVMSGLGECQELDYYFFARYLTKCKSLIVSFEVQNRTNFRYNHKFSILLSEEDKPKLVEIGNKVSRGEDSLDLVELSKILPEAILVDSLHRERCYLKNVILEASKTCYYMQRFGIEKIIGIFSRSELDTAVIHDYEAAFSTSSLRLELLKKIPALESVQTKQLKKLYEQEAREIEAKIRADFPEIIFRNTGPLLIADVSKDSEKDLCRALEMQKIEFYSQEKPDGVVSLILNCYVSL